MASMDIDQRSTNRAIERRANLLSFYEYSLRFIDNCRTNCFVASFLSYRRACCRRRDYLAGESHSMRSRSTGPPAGWKSGSRSNAAARRASAPKRSANNGTWGICNNNNDLYTESGQTLQGSFSAVSKPNFTSKY